MVCSDSNFFLVNLCQRLNYELGRPKTVVKKPLTISPAHTPSKDLMAWIVIGLSSSPEGSLLKTCEGDFYSLAVRLPLVYFSGVSLEQLRVCGR